MKLFRNREDSLKFGLSFFFIAGSILGTLFCNFMTDEMKLGLNVAEQEIVTSDLLKNIDFATLFFRITTKRIWTLALVLLVSITTAATPLIMVICGCFSFSTATLLCTLTMNSGALGLVRYLALIFPQCLLYIPAMYLLLWWIPVYEKRVTLLSTIFLAALTLAGACLETLVNPWILALFHF